MRKLMNDNVVTYSRTTQQAATYFTENFEEKRANPSVLGEGLNAYVLMRKTTNNLMSYMIKSAPVKSLQIEICCKHRSRF